MPNVYLNSLGAGATNQFPTIKDVAVKVLAGTATTSTSADATLVGGRIYSWIPTAGASDKYVNLVKLNADGSITVTLSGNTTADMTYTVSVDRVILNG